MKRSALAAPCILVVCCVLFMARDSIVVSTACTHKLLAFHITLIYFAYIK